MKLIHPLPLGLVPYVSGRRALRPDGVGAQTAVKENGRKGAQGHDQSGSMIPAAFLGPRSGREMALDPGFDEGDEGREHPQTTLLPRTPTEPSRSGVSERDGSIWRPVRGTANQRRR